MKQLSNHGERAVCVGTMRRLPMLALLVCVGAMGCRHKIAAYTIPVGAQVPVELEEPQTDNDADMIESLPLPDLGTLPLPATPPPAPRRRPASPKEEVPQPAATVETPPVEVAIGNLSTGADATPQIHQQAQDMISSILRRIAALSSRTAAAQRSDLNKVRYFLKQAQQALNTGDMDGAQNLAVKAKVLMDDLEKR